MTKHHDMADTGRPGRPREGSMIWQISKLEPGQSLLLASRGEYRGVGGFMANVQLAIGKSVRSGALPGDFYVVKTCVGHTIDCSEMPFKFLQVTRAPLLATTSNEAGTEDPAGEESSSERETIRWR